jgi:hypothetical protein
MVRAIEGAVRGDRSVLYELVRATEGGFAANKLRLSDEANAMADAGLGGGHDGS